MRFEKATVRNLALHVGALFPNLALLHSCSNLAVLRWTFSLFLLLFEVTMSTKGYGRQQLARKPQKLGSEATNITITQHWYWKMKLYVLLDIYQQKVLNSVPSLCDKAE